MGSLCLEFRRIGTHGALDHLVLSGHIKRMYLRREAVHVSVAYRYHNPSWDLVRNRSVYGEDHSEIGLGANMSIWLQVGVPRLSAHKLIGPDSLLQKPLGEIHRLLDQRCLFEAEPYFTRHVPTLENIAQFLSERIWSFSLGVANWHSLRIEENQEWCVEVYRSGQRPRLTHRFSRHQWRIEATIEGKIDVVNGLLVQRSVMREALAATQFDQPQEFYARLRSRLPQLKQLRIQDSHGWAGEYGS
jgi:hypothetical protein